jgi:DNA-binding NarL/FixJ family response regulator
MMSGPRIRCVVADDHPAIVDAVCRFLDEAPDIEVVGRAGDGETALALIHELAPDLALVDVRMPRLSGIEVARRLADGAAVLLYTGEADRTLLLEALDVGARGFLLKDSPLADLVRAIRVVHGGGTYVDPALASLLTGPAATSKLASLTPREREVLRMLADGMRNDRIALELEISPLTVKAHVRNAMDKLEADTRTQAVARALRESVID